MLKHSIFLFIALILVRKVFTFTVTECKSDELTEYPNQEYVDSLESSPFKCYNGGICIQVNFNSTSSTKICSCKEGFTGQQCTQLTMACSSNPCGPNGYCNSLLNNEHESGYFCRCKPGFSGETCQENINDCLNATCYNDGLCIDRINSYECECKWPYIGRYCQTKMTCQTDNICKNNGVCIDQPDTESVSCVCPDGFDGVDCSVKVDACLSQPCMHNGICSHIDNGNDYKCDCLDGRLGKNCELEDICLVRKPCKNNSTCVNLIQTSQNKNNNNEFEKGRQLLAKLKTTKTNALYYCECNNKHFTGINCDINTKQECNGSKCKITTLQTTTTTTTSSSSSTTTPPAEKSIISAQNELITTLLAQLKMQPSTQSVSSKITTKKMISIQNNEKNENNNNTNGSFVLVVNIDPKEFIARKSEIVKEFEKRFGILMLIKKEENSDNEMIYEYYPHVNSRVAWTKIYFIIIFACLLKQHPTELNSQPPHSITHSICLENNIENLNDAFQILTELKKSSSLLPNYVSNISYEAYKTDAINKHANSNSEGSFHTNDSSRISTSVVICLAIVILAAITLILGILLRQNIVKKVKAPIWFPPVASDNSPAGEYATTIHNNETIYEKVQANKEIKYGTSSAFNKSNAWSVNKAFDDFTHIFHSNKQINKIGEISPTSSFSGKDSNDDSDLNPPVKMRRLDVSGMPIHNPTNQPSTPEYYPSPPESLPDASFHNMNTNNTNNSIQLNPINFKGGFQAVTPLMLFIMGRSKLKQNSKFNGTYQSQNMIGENDIIETFISNGADINSKNSEGETALHLAARYGLIEIAKSLLLNGADLNAYDNSGRNCLHTAVGSNEYELVKMLLNHCSIASCQADEKNDENQVNFDDRFDLVDSKTTDDLADTALIIAARLNFNEIIQLLIEFNASVNATDAEGRSALHWCSKVNNLNGALLLIQAGANVNMQDNDEKTPLSSALSELFTKDIADLLIKFDAFVSTDDEIKYNKMKSIIDSFATSNKNPSQFNIDAIKTDLFNKIKQESNSFLNHNNKKASNTVKEGNMAAQQKESTNKTSKLIGTSTKRKLSETISSQTEPVILENKKRQSKSFNKQTIMEQQALGNNCKVAYMPLTPSPPINSNYLANRSDHAQSSFYTNQNGFYFNQSQINQDNFSLYNRINESNQTNHFTGNSTLLNDNKTYFDYSMQNNVNTHTTSYPSQNVHNANYNLFNYSFNENYAAYF